MLMRLRLRLAPLVLISDIMFNTAAFIPFRSNDAQPGLIYSWLVVDGQVSGTQLSHYSPTRP